MKAAFQDSVLLKGRALKTTYYRENPTQAYVSIPPALIITDSNGATWTLGFEYVQNRGQFFFNVLRNDVDTGEHASNIEYRQGKIRIRCSDGTQKAWRERPSGSLSRAPGYWF
jgi:hypothetical protein